MNYQYSVIVPFVRHLVSTADLTEIGARIAERDPTLHWCMVELKRHASLNQRRLPRLPSVMIQFHGYGALDRVFPDFTGPQLRASATHKAKQLRMLESAGVPVPPWTRLERKTELAPDVFGEHVMIKSTERGASFGRGIVLIRTADFPAFRDEHARKYDEFERSAPLVQQFINTGENAGHYRIVTFMGRVVHSRFQINTAKTPFNAPSTRMILDEKIASNTGERECWLEKDEIVNNLAREVAKVFSTPVLAIDIIKSNETGELYVLEANAGDCWMFSSAPGDWVREKFGDEAVYGQYDVYSVVADAIIKEARAQLSLEPLAASA